MQPDPAFLISVVNLAPRSANRLVYCP